MSSDFYNEWITLKEDHILTVLPYPFANNEFLTVLDEIPTRCTIIMDIAFWGGLLANVIAVIALTADKRQPVLLGETLINAFGEAHPGLILTGIPMLCADVETLREIRKAALEKVYAITNVVNITISDMGGK